MNNKRLRDKIKKMGPNKKLTQKEIANSLNEDTYYGASLGELNNALFDMWKDKEIYKVGVIFVRRKPVWIWLTRFEPDCKYFKNTNSRKNVEESYNQGFRLFELGKCKLKKKTIIDNDDCVKCFRMEV